MAILIMVLVSFVFIGIGIFQYRQKDIPVTFYTGESPLDPRCVNDVKAFNQKHGMMWIIFGVVLLVSQLIGALIANRTSILFMIVPLLVGIVCLFLYHHHLMRTYVIENRRLSEAVPLKKGQKILIGIFTIGILCFVGIMLFVGSIDVTFENNALSLSAMSVKTLRVNYDAIESIEYAEDVDRGRRDFGIGSITLSAGDFSNEEFGKYKLYSYNSCDDLIILHMDNGIVAFNGKDEKTTKEYYDKLESIKG